LATEETIIMDKENFDSGKLSAGKVSPKTVSFAKDCGFSSRDFNWNILLERIVDKKCTPFIGAGASANFLPTAKQLANAWASKFKYPLQDKNNLARVAEYVISQTDPMYPKENIQKMFSQKGSPDFNNPNEPHSLLAELRLPIYITTNYDDYMKQAIECHGRDCNVQYTHWNHYLKSKCSNDRFDSDFTPNPHFPLVFHLHGCCEPWQSMVLTERDYIDFLINLSRDKDMLPPCIVEALAGTSLLFIGYSLDDWTLRVIFRGLMSSMGANLGCKSLAVQLRPNGKSDDEQARACEFLKNYFRGHFKVDIDIYWGNTDQFVSEFRTKWEALKNR